MNKATENDVFDAIRGERDYQHKRWGTGGQSHSNLEYLAYIRDYVEEAMHRCSRVVDSDCEVDTQDSLRKIASLAVCAMEVNGVHKRGEK